jgi:hypothetical protein
MVVDYNETILTSEETSELFKQASPFDGDYSLHALYRAIVLEHESIGGAADISVLKEKSVIKQFRIVEKPSIKTIVDVDYPVCLIKYWGEDFQGMTIDAEGWESMGSVTCPLDRFLSQVTPSKVYINRDSRRVIATVKGSISATWIQNFESMLWLMLPWYYPERKDEEIKFFKSISTGKNAPSKSEAKQNLISYVNGVAEKHNVRDLQLHALLDGVQDSYRQSQLQEYSEQRDTIEGEISDYTAYLQNKYRRLMEVMEIIKGLELLAPEEDSTWFDFFKQHKNVKITEVSGADIFYSVVDTLEFYDEDEVKLLLDNETSWSSDYKSMLPMLKTIFVEKRGIFRVNACFKLSNLSLVTPIKRKQADNGGMPNPHIYNYACSGGNDRYYSQYANEGSWDLAIEQSIAATKNWAVGDAAVGRRMFDWIEVNNTVPCIYVTDGSPMTNGVTSDARLVSLEEYAEIIRKKTEQEGTNNG